MAGPELIQREIAHQDIGSAVVLDVVRLERGEVQAFFAVGTKAEQISAGDGTEIKGIRSVGDGMIVSVEAEGAPVLAVDGTAQALRVSEAELGLFEGLDTLFATRNGESAQVTLDWLAYHAEKQGAEAALILDRCQPGQGKQYLKRLKRGLKKIEGLKRVVHVVMDVPLGDPSLPSEAHPFNAPDAPGKDRMEIPAPSPWDSPQRELQLFEWARHRFLDRAKGVALVDVCDLIVPHSGETETVFETTRASKTGAITLAGRNCYPWRVRKGEEAGFGDHICVQFDARKLRRRWCVAPQIAGDSAVWRLIRIVGANPEATEWRPFYRFMALRHPTDTVSQIVPKTSLVEDDRLLALAEERFGHKPVRMPEIGKPKVDPQSNRTCIITCMKNEGPFILEWVAYHRAIGVQDFIVYTNDCTDGTDDFLDLLQEKGILQHRDNPFKGTGLKPQHAALQAGEKEEIIKKADWVISMDVDEFINVKVGKGTLEDLFEATGGANMISCTWRLFGNSDIHEFVDEPLIAQYTRCAEEMTRKPHQAWGFKTLFRNIGLFKKLGVHRPKGLNPQLWDQINWVNGSGVPLPKDMYRNAWRSTTSSVGYDMVQLNHYAVRSAESFLVKRDRGRVNHVDRDQGLAYWFRMNNNATEDTSIQRMIPMLREEMDRLMADPEIAEAHAYCVDKHRAKIDALKATENYAKFYDDLTGERMETLARIHHVFGANVFLAGPDVIPDDVVQKDPPEGFFFTVEKQKTVH
ncbi:MAG: glycosyltransferase family 2 protein [Rhodobacteraceae bacterium]|nr:glycosyltransferase family 2 protein [Paracoccaceae bacterium]